MSRDDASLSHLDGLSRTYPYNYYTEKASPFVKDKDMKYADVPTGLTIFSEFRRGDDDVFSFAELFLSSLPKNSANNYQYTIGQHIPVVFQKDWGMVALYSPSMKVMAGSSGSLVAYNNNILSVLHSVNGKEFRGDTPYPGSTVIIGTKVDIADDDSSSTDPTRLLGLGNSSPPPSAPGSLPQNPGTSSPPSSSSPPAAGNSPPDKIGTSDPTPRSPSSVSESGANPGVTPPQKGQPPQESGGSIVTRGMPAPSVPSGSQNQQRDTASNPCMP